MHFQHDGHDHFHQFPRQRAFVTQVEIFDQLLGQRATALGHTPLFQVCQHGAGNAPKGNAVMVVKVLILYGQQCIGQRWRQLAELDQLPILFVGRVDAAHHHRLKSGQINRIARGIAQRTDFLASKTQPHQLGGFAAIPKLKPPGKQLDSFGSHAVLPRFFCGTDPLVAQLLQLPLQVCTGERLAGVQFQCPAVDMGGKGPFFPGKLLIHHGVEHQQ